MDEFFEKISFPYSSVREGQDKFIKDVYAAIGHKKNLMVSAPTGLGKTISALAPAIYQAQKENKTVICLTSRQTQANQIIKTVEDISKKAQKPINYVAFIGKRNMCAHSERDLYPATDFNDFCKKVRETGKCKYYKNARDTEKEEEVKSVLENSSKTFMNVEQFVHKMGGCQFCPYEMAGFKAFGADLVICDFNYLFSIGIRENFLGKIGRNLNECIVVVDEAHNLPDRIRMSYSYNLSTDLIKNAMRELNDHIKSSDYDDYIIAVKAALEDLFFERLDGEKKDFLISRDEYLAKLLSKFTKEIKLEEVVDKLYIAANLIKEDKIISYVERVANFLEKWAEIDENSFLRVLEKQVKDQKTILNLRIKCIDPSEIASDVLNNSYSSILMSGTLSPIKMYKDILGVENCQLLELKSPFASKNQLTLVENEVTTKFTARSPQMFKLIAEKIEDVLNADDSKNAIVFFPGYDLLDKIVSNISVFSLNRKILKEQRYMTKEDKEKFVIDFKNKGLDTKSRVLFAITSGSFAEGLDLPDDALEMVIVVGLPLAVPDVFTQAVIRHFDKKLGKGQLYGYIYPAMSKIIQAAGRCIRTENDKGVIVLMDARFLFPLYAQSFPLHWQLKTVNDPKLEIMNFFNE